jgi:hypothetical protein
MFTIGPGHSILSTRTTTTPILFSHHYHVIFKSSVQEHSSGDTYSLNHGGIDDCSITTGIKMGGVLSIKALKKMDDSESST